MAEFVWPDWLPTAPELPPPPVDADRIDGLTKGHHWVSGPIRRLPNLSAEARKVFNNAVSGPYGEPHRWCKEHIQYNHAVQELWNKNKYSPSKMTAEDAEDFIRQVKRSRDPRIAPFRDIIRDKRLTYELGSEGRPRGGSK